jgi:competence protein ComEA
LEQVPGIGPSLAKAIEDHRAKKGPFKSIEELRQVKGIGPATFEKVVPYLQIDPASLPPTEPQSPPSDSSSAEPLVLERKSTPTAPPPAPKASGNAKKIQPGDPPIDVNAAALEELTRLPGIGPTTAKHIIDARSEHPFKTLADLDKVKGIGPKTLEKIRPFILLK